MSNLQQFYITKFYFESKSKYQHKLELVLQLLKHKQQFLPFMFTSIKFKIKDGYKLELQTPEIMKFFGSTKKIIEKTKYRENVQVLKQLKYFQSNMMQQIININKSLKYHTHLLQVNLMLIC